MRTVGHPGRGDRAQRHDVAQTAIGLLEIRFQQMRKFADLREPVPASLRQLRQPQGRLPPPVAQHACAEDLGDLRISRDVAGVDQAERHGEIVRRDRPCFRDGSHRMVKGDTRVPTG